MNKIIFIMLVLANSANATIKQSLGVDQKVNYSSLINYGPWDDRNYQLIQKDLSLLPDDDQYLANVPAFFKILYRKQTGYTNKYYPRSTYQAFLMQYGGILRNGIWYKEGLGKHYYPGVGYGMKPILPIIETKAATTETPLESFGDEITIECNPTNKNNCVAGMNSGSGVAIYYSTNSGATWTKSQTNPNSCCDSTIDWSSDGSIVYQADMSGGQDNGIRYSRSIDQGVTWSALQHITQTGSDKEFIHVDRAPASPHKDNIYLTWHDGNVMQFSRSTDMGLNFSNPMSFGSEPSGIGSDITSDLAGNVYYFYPSFGSGIRVLKSTNGGTSFATGTQVSSLNGSFDMAIPAMETRKAFIYVSTDVNKTNGDIYVAWTDEADDSAGGGNGDVNTNHAWIKVAKSTNQGASWTMCAQPHDTSDSLANNPIDRFSPWLKVGETGVVHIGYYDTRHSQNRTGVDFYYTSSTNNCTSWETESRYTTQTSVNIENGQEWGDYNGLSVVLDKLAVSFTDNRGGTQSAMVASSDLGGTNPGGTCSAGGEPSLLHSYDFESGEQGWTHGALVGTDGWSLSSASPHGGSQAMHGQSFAVVNDSYLLSPSITLPSDSAGLTLQFWNKQDIESDAPGCYDGAILEISTDGGNNFQQIPISALSTDPYDGVIGNTAANPLAGMQAWCGDPQDYLNSIVDLSAYAGQSVIFSFRKGNDNDVSQGGWDIDDVKIIGCGAGGVVDPIFANGFE